MVAKSPKVNGWIEGSSESSPDPLTMSSHTFPKLTTPIRARSKTPVSQRLSRSIKKQLTFEDESDLRASPTKSITMDTPGNASPWRIKVTVEAEPRDDGNGEFVDFDVKSSPKKSSKKGVTKTTIPLKEADDSPPSRARRKPRKSSGPSSGVRKRKPTPARRKSTRKADSPPLLSELSVGSSPSQPTRTRQRSKSRQLAEEDATKVPPAPKIDTAIDSQLHHQIYPPASRPPKSREALAFNFTELTPLHQKHILGPPVEESQFRQAQHNQRRRRAGIVPQGWTAPVFSPLPRRSSPAQQPDKPEDGDDLSPLNGLATFTPVFEARETNAKAPLVKERPSIGLARGNSQQNQDQARVAVESASEARGNELRDRDQDQELSALRIIQEDQKHPKQDQVILESQKQKAESDAVMWRNMIKHSAATDDEAATDGAKESDDDNDDDDDEVGMAAEVTGVVGDATMMQSEEFSMVSIGSLPSARELHSSFVDNGGLQPSRTHASELQKLVKQNPNALPLSTDYTPQKLFPEAQRIGTPSSKRSANSNSPNKAERNLDDTIASQPETPADVSSKIQDMSSIMRSWRRNLPAVEPSFIPVAQLKSTPIKIQHALPGSNRPAKDLAQIPKRGDLGMSSSRLSSGLRDKAPDVARLPTPSSSENDFDTVNLPSPTAEDDDTASVHSLRTRLQRAAEEQLRSESNASYAAGSAAVTKEADQPENSAQQSPNDTLSYEMQWQREREEVIRQAEAANSSRVITINSDSEDVSEDSGEEPEPLIPQSDGVDIWQEEASRSADLGNEKSREKSKERSFTGFQLDLNPRPSKVARTWRTSSVPDASHEREGRTELASSTQDVSKAFTIEPEHVQQDESAAAIRNMFKSITGTTYSPVKGRNNVKKEQMCDHEGDEDGAHTTANVESELDEVKEPEDSLSHSSEEDTGMFWQHNLPTIFGSNLRSDARDTQNELRSPDAHGTILNDTTAFSSSPIKPNSTMLSDVRQVRREVQYASNLRAHIEEIDSEEANSEGSITYATSSLRHIEPKRAIKPLFSTTNTTPLKRKQPPVDNAPQRPSLPTIPPHAPAPPPSLIARLYNSFTTPPQRPPHPLLAKLPLLPKNEPWTRTHYRVLDSLYQHYKAHPSAFSPYHPSNKELLTPKWRHFEGTEFTNHGLTVAITRPMLVLAATFAELLRLESIREFERVEGVLIDDAGFQKFFAVRDEGVTAIAEFSVVVRVFTMVAGEWVREEEGRGRVFEKGNMLWRIKGEGEWDGGRRAFWRVQGVVDGLAGK